MAPESPERAPWRVVDDEARVEPHKVTSLAKAPVEFIILIAHEGLVVAPDLIERSATERAEVHGVGRPFEAATAKLRRTSAEPRSHGNGDRVRPATRADCLLDTADVARTGASRCVQHSLEISLGDLSLGVDPDDKIAARLGDGPVERRWREPRGVLDPAYPRVTHRPRVDPRRGVITRRPGGNDDVELELNVLGQERLQAAIDHLGCVTSRDHHGERQRRRAEVGSHRASRRAITTMVSSMIMRSSTGDQLTTYCRS